MNQVAKLGLILRSIGLLVLKVKAASFHKMPLAWFTLAKYFN